MYGQQFKLCRIVGGMVGGDQFLLLDIQSNGDGYEINGNTKHVAGTFHDLSDLHPVYMDGTRYERVGADYGHCKRGQVYTPIAQFRSPNNMQFVFHGDPNLYDADKFRVKLEPVQFPSLPGSGQVLTGNATDYVPGAPRMILSTDPAKRKATPITTGVIDYFPRALAAVAQTSKAGNDQHSPGKPLRWNREVSTDHADCIARHLIDRGKYDTDGQRHSAKLAWRALALLEIELEEEEKARGVQ